MTEPSLSEWCRKRSPASRRQRSRNSGHALPPQSREFPSWKLSLIHISLWDAANRYLHAHLPEGVKTLPISAWEKEYTALKAQREAEYETLKDTRAEVAELQKIRR